MKLTCSSSRGLMDKITSLIIGGIPISEDDSANAFSLGIGLHGRCDDVRTKNYPNNHIVDYLKNIINRDDYEVWDIGGSSGIYFFASGADKSNTTWRVFEMPETYERYNWIISGTCNCANLSFERYQTGDEIIPKTGKSIIILAVGAFQYLEKPLEFLSKHEHKANIVILKDLNISNQTFLACQKGVGICWFHNIGDIESRLSNFKYNIIEEDKEYLQFLGPRELSVYPLKTIIAKRR